MKRVGWVALWWTMQASGAHAVPCTKLEDASAQQDAARQTADARYAKALVARKLTPVTLAQLRLRAHDVGDTVRGDFKADTVEAAEDHGAQVKVVTGIAGSCGGDAAAFVQQGSKIFRAVRAPKPGAKLRLETCTCPGPPGGCGMRATARAIGYVLPAGTTFGGVLPIAYVEDTVEITHAGACTPGAPPP